jgi:hypothetical protein
LLGIGQQKWKVLGPDNGDVAIDPGRGKFMAFPAYSSVDVQKINAGTLQPAAELYVISRQLYFQAAASRPREQASPVVANDRECYVKRLLQALSEVEHVLPQPRRL